LYIAVYSLQEKTKLKCSLKNRAVSLVLIYTLVMTSLPKEIGLWSRTGEWELEAMLA